MNLKKNEVGRNFQKMNTPLKLNLVRKLGCTQASSLENKLM
jgi:hypothetical protein